MEQLFLLHWLPAWAGIVVRLQLSNLVLKSHGSFITCTFPRMPRKRLNFNLSFPRGGRWSVVHTKITWYWVLCSHLCCFHHPLMNLGGGIWFTECVVLYKRCIKKTTFSCNDTQPLRGCWNGRLFLESSQTSQTPRTGASKHAQMERQTWRRQVKESRTEVFRGEIAYFQVFSIIDFVKGKEREFGRRRKWIVCFILVAWRWPLRVCLNVSGFVCVLFRVPFLLAAIKSASELRSSELVLDK